jgi:hypothetical protein
MKRLLLTLLLLWRVSLLAVFNAYSGEAEH